LSVRESLALASGQEAIAMRRTERAARVAVIGIVVPLAVDQLFGVVFFAAPAAPLNAASRTRIFIFVVSASILTVVLPIPSVSIRASTPEEVVASMTSFTAIKRHISYLQK
jgi:hypothetical protein